MATNRCARRTYVNYVVKTGIYCECGREKTHPLGNSLHMECPVCDSKIKHSDNLNTRPQGGRFYMEA